MESSMGSRFLHARETESGVWICRLLFCVVAATPLVVSVPARADLIDDFMAEYPAAGQRLREAYRHVRVTGKRTTHKDDGTLFGIVDLQEIRDGDSVLQLTTSIQNIHSNWPPGSVTANGGDAHEYFQLSKAKGAESYRVLSFGPRPQLEPSLRQAMPSLVSSYCTSNGPTVATYLTDPSSKVLSAHLTELDGRQVVEVDVERAARGTTAERHLFFERPTWALAGWSEYLGGMICQGRVRYQPGTDPPKISFLHEWIESPKQAGRKTSENQWEFSSVEFGPTPKERFTLGAFGVRKPGEHEVVKVQVNRSHRWELIVAANLLLLFGIMLWLGIGSRRRRRQARVADAASPDLPSEQRSE